MIRIEMYDYYLSIREEFEFKVLLGVDKEKLNYELKKKYNVFMKEELILFNSIYTRNIEECIKMIDI